MKNNKSIIKNIVYNITYLIGRIIIILFAFGNVLELTNPHGNIYTATEDVKYVILFYAIFFGIYVIYDIYSVCSKLLKEE